MPRILEPADQPLECRHLRGQARRLGLHTISVGMKGLNLAGGRTRQSEVIKGGLERAHVLLNNCPGAIDRRQAIKLIPHGRQLNPHRGQIDLSRCKVL